jgi:thiamine monophosphate kinase
VVTVRRGGWEEAVRAAEGAGGELIRIGEVLPGSKVFLVRGAEEVEIPPKGWEHLK